MLTKQELQEIKICAFLCKEVYKGKEYFPTSSNFTFVESGNMEALIFSSPGHAYIAIRGTDSLKDFMMDINCGMSSYPLSVHGSRVHKGFKKGYDQIHFKIREELGRLSNNGPLDLTITGHSLGGAVATILAARLQIITLYDIKKLVTFGSPRVGNKYFAEHCNILFGKRIYRMDNNNDVVTSVPPEITGYKHCNQHYYITSKGKILSEIPKWKRRADKMKGYFGSFIRKFGGDFHLDSARDHFIDSYIEQVNR